MTRALVSVHDVMPETLDRVERLVEVVERAGRGPVTLLVVPGRSWRAPDLERVRALVERGHEPAAHGWVHRVEVIRGLRHRIHSLLVSRDVAEHLALDERGIAALMRRSHDWFERNDLPRPRLYVPPAWALGSLSTSTLRDLPFDRVEVLSGVLSPATGSLDRVPVVGYEAAERWRVPPVRLWNLRARRRASSVGWLRIGIHPFDLDLPLADDLARDLARSTSGGSYDELANRG